MSRSQWQQSQWQQQHQAGVGHTLRQREREGRLRGYSRPVQSENSTGCVGALVTALKKLVGLLILLGLGLAFLSSFLSQ